MGDPIFARVSEASARPQAVQLASSIMELVRKATNSWPDIKPWVDAADVASLVAKARAEARTLLVLLHAAVCRRLVCSACPARCHPPTVRRWTSLRDG